MARNTKKSAAPAPFAVTADMTKTIAAQLTVIASNSKDAEAAAAQAEGEVRSRKFTAYGLLSSVGHTALTMNDLDARKAAVVALFEAAKGSLPAAVQGMISGIIASKMRRAIDIACSPKEWQTAMDELREVRNILPRKVYRTPDEDVILTIAEKVKAGTWNRAAFTAEKGAEAQRRETEAAAKAAALEAAKAAQTGAAATDSKPATVVQVAPADYVKARISDPAAVHATIREQLEALKAAGWRGADKMLEEMDTLQPPPKSPEPSNVADLESFLALKQETAELKAMLARLATKLGA